MQAKKGAHEIGANAVSRRSTRHSFCRRAIPIVMVVMGLLVIHPPIGGIDRTAGELVASRYARVQFTHAVNDTVGLNATIWLPQRVNDSYVWSHNSTLTWAFDPNLAFWGYLWANIPQLTGDQLPENPIKSIWWSLPMKDFTDPASEGPTGRIIDFNNGTYDHSGLFVSQYPTATFISESYYAVDNFTIIARDVPLFPAANWSVIIWLECENLSRSAWTSLTDTLAAQLNATWYIRSCVFPKHTTGDNGSPWPIEAVFLGLLVLGGLGSKRRLSTKKRLA